MSRYIDAEKLLRRWTVAESGTRFPLHDCDNFPITVTLKDVQNSIRNAPAADVEPVVRCKDCKWLQALNCPLAFIENHAIQFLCRPPEWHCADGERKEREEK